MSDLQNVVTNICYLIAGFFVLRQARRWLGQLVGISLIVLAIGSAWYHATRNDTANLLDIAGVSLVLFSLIAYGIATLKRVSRPSWNLSAQANIVVTVFIVAFAFIAAEFRTRIDLFNSTRVALLAGGVLLVLLIFSHRITKPSMRVTRWQIIAVVTFAIAGLFRGCEDGFGASQFWCAPNGLIQQHAVWHVFSAIGLYALFESFFNLEAEQKTVV